MSGLTAAQRESLHRALLTLRAETRQLLADSTEGAQPVSLDEPIGRLSRMDAMQQQSMVQANRRTAQNRLARIDAALRRVDHDEYGMCVECEEEIGYARLTAQPETPFCIDCQSRKEVRVL